MQYDCPKMRARGSKAVENFSDNSSVLVARKKTKKLYFSQWVCERAVFEPNMQNHPSKQQQDAICYLLESKVAQYLIQKYHQPSSEMLIASPHILLALLTLLTLLTLLKLLKLSKVRVHWASVDKIPKSTCGANKSCIVKHRLRWFMVFFQICTAANREMEKRRRVVLYVSFSWIG